MSLVAILLSLSYEELDRVLLIAVDGAGDVAGLSLFVGMIKDLNRSIGNVSEKVTRTRKALDEYQKAIPHMTHQLIVNDEENYRAAYRSALR
ncbi:hypothetical protein Nepgr_027709 [Nepenthes gracilis]|uniref:Uncharacterized protein n=1 Tax=Nepenthes gracilis TaxID=150966 RepID=A0AAD3TBV8_NEPGR|nr:hypothetical protein Nepgr_027709 [Nepenthes gracilis]